MKLSHLILVALAALLLAATSAAADRMAELKEQFKQRYEQLQSLKSAGTIGETAGGYVDFVGDAVSDAKEFVDAENTDRRELYKLIAEKEKVAAEKVAERNGARNFEKAKKGEYLKGKDGKWSQKA